MLDEQFKKELAEAVATAVVATVKSEAGNKAAELKSAASDKMPKVIGIAGIAMTALAASAFVTASIANALAYKKGLRSNVDGEDDE